MSCSTTIRAGPLARAQIWAPPAVTSPLATPWVIVNWLGCAPNLLILATPHFIANADVAYCEYGLRTSSSTLRSSREPRASELPSSPLFESGSL